MEKKANAIIVHMSDNVVTTLVELKKNEIARYKIDKDWFSTILKSDIPFGHKLAINEIKKDDHIIKYGEVIGIATKDIAQGEHVHVHNVDSARSKVDK